MPNPSRSSKLEPWYRIMVTFSHPWEKISTYRNQGQSNPFIRTLFTLGTCAPIPGTRVQSFEDEKDMLMAWHKFFMEVDPDIITGYNITQFDIYYLLERASVLKLVQFPYSGRIKCRSTSSVSKLGLIFPCSLPAALWLQQRPTYFFLVPWLRRTYPSWRISPSSRIPPRITRAGCLQTQ